MENNFWLCGNCNSLALSQRFRFPDFNLVKEKFGIHEYMDLGLMILLQQLRNMVGSPFIIHCGYKEEGHAKSSFHYYGKAVDLHPKMGLQCMLKIVSAWWPGGVGVYFDWIDNGVHLDTGPLRRWVRDNGKYHNVENFDRWVASEETKARFERPF
jgi:hypothetical protein